MSRPLPRLVSYLLTSGNRCGALPSLLDSVHFSGRNDRYFCCKIFCFVLMLSLLALSPGLLVGQPIDFVLRSCCYCFAAGAPHDAVPRSKSAVYT